MTPPSRVVSNWRVVVHPSHGWIGTPTNTELRTTCERIKRDIERHIDEIEAVKIEFDSKLVCTHCSHLWVPRRNGYNGCCQTHTDEWCAQYPGQDPWGEDEIKSVKPEDIIPDHSDGGLIKSPFMKFPYRVEPEEDE